MNIAGISFSTWLKNHATDHSARWCRELYPWALFRALDYSPDAIGVEQAVRFRRCDHLATVFAQKLQDNGRMRYDIRVEARPSTAIARWEHSPWDDDFVLIAATTGQFITLYTQRRDPNERLVKAFMRGDFRTVESRRSLPVSILLIRTLVCYVAEQRFGEFAQDRVFPMLAERNTAGTRPASVSGPDWPRVPFLSRGRDLWIEFAFTEEIAHRRAVRDSGQCDQLLYVYIQPSFGKHHRANDSYAQVVPLWEFVQADDSADRKDFGEHARVLMNHLRDPIDDPNRHNVGRLLSTIRRSSDGVIRIETSYLNEAKVGLEVNVSTTADAAYFFACANLLNAALNRNLRVYTGSRRLVKDVYSFKARLGEIITQLIDHPLDSVNIYFDEDTHCLITVEGVQFGFDAVPANEATREFRCSENNVPQEWTGLRLQRIAPLVLDWARAVRRQAGSRN